MRREASFPAARWAAAPGWAFVPAFGGDLVADLRGLLAREAPLTFGFALLLDISIPFGQMFLSRRYPPCARFSSAIFSFFIFNMACITRPEVFGSEKKSPIMLGLTCQERPNLS